MQTMKPGTNQRPSFGFGGILIDFTNEIAVGATGQARADIDATYDLEVRYLQGNIFASQAEGGALAGSPLYYGSGASQTASANTFAPLRQCRINFTSGNRDWFDEPIPANLVLGDGIHPFPLPVWRTIAAGTTINCVIVNGTAATEVKAEIALLGQQFVRQR